MTPLDTLIAKEEIRELAQLYARGVDRQDIALLRTLYTPDGWDAHGDHFDGPAQEYVDFLAASLPYMPIGAHLICNHLISVTGDTAEGEAYSLAWHLVPNGAGGHKHDLRTVRYVDSYRKEDGRWLFARRDVCFDLKLILPAEDHGPKADPAADVSYTALLSTLFSRGVRS